MLRACLCQMRGTFGCRCQTFFFPLLKIKKKNFVPEQKKKFAEQESQTQFHLLYRPLESFQMNEHRSSDDRTLFFCPFFRSGRLVASILNDPVKMFPVHSSSSYRYRGDCIYNIDRRAKFEAIKMIREEIQIFARRERKMETVQNERVYSLVSI